MDNRWHGIERPYSQEDVKALRDRFGVRHIVAEKGSKKLWSLMQSEPFVNALGAMSGNQGVQQAKAGLKAIYVSGWQTAADANSAGETYPDLSLYPVNSVPLLVERINNGLRRADQIDNAGNIDDTEWLCPIMADAEAGFGGPLNVYELMKSMIKAGAAGVHFEDQLASEKKCGHMGGKVLVPTSQFIRTLTAARLAADVMDVPTVLVARTDADSAKLITSDIDPYDHDFILDPSTEAGKRTPEGFYKLCGTSMERCVARGLAYAPYADMIWMETGKPNVEQARIFAEAIHAKFPGKPLMYNCSPSFNWNDNLTPDEIASFQKDLGKMGYKFLFVTLPGFHSLNYNMWNLARDYKDRQMEAYAKLQGREFEAKPLGYGAVNHQEFVGTKYFDKVKDTIFGGASSTTAFDGSTEEEQF
jgi:isocitrate lyase